MLVLFSSLLILIVFSQVVSFQNNQILRKLQRSAFKSCPEFKLTCNNNASTGKDDNLVTYFFGREGEFSNDLKRINIDPVRFVSYMTLAALLAVGANFVGVTSYLLSNAPDNIQKVAKNSGIDQLYSISGYKRYLNVAKGYEFIFPESWLVDQSIVLAEARERELPESIRQKKIREVFIFVQNYQNLY